MTQWLHRIKVRHLWQNNAASTPEEVQRIADALLGLLQGYDCMADFTKRERRWLRSVEKRDDPVVSFDKILDRMYDYCDARKIWVEF